MKTAAYQLELITPCFCGGAEPDKQAEIRAPSIRGQLRWWFRTLGGFKSLAERKMSIRQQEELIFGNAAGNSGAASPLIVRVKAEDKNVLRSSVVKDAVQMNADINTPRGYFLFPLRSNPKKGESKGRAVLNSGQSPQRFNLVVLWRGNQQLWPDIEALLNLFGHLGSLGFRSRRAMGALAFCRDTHALKESLRHFSKHSGLTIGELPASDSESAITALAQWLKKWRSYGRSPNNLNAFKPGFLYAKVDHDIAAQGMPGCAYRPALGLPIISKYGDWNLYSGYKSSSKGRFASPILLRPYRKIENGQTTWHALVIFVDAHKWPEGKPVYLNGQSRQVSLDLYEAMKNDPGLQQFF